MGIALDMNLFDAAKGRRGKWEKDMGADVRNASMVWLVCRRDGATRIPHIQAVCVAEGRKTARTIARRMCCNETYFCFPLPVNVLLPERIITATGLEWPAKPKGKDLRLATG